MNVYIFIFFNINNYNLYYIFEHVYAFPPRLKNSKSFIKKTKTKIAPLQKKVLQKKINLENIKSASITICGLCYPRCKVINCESDQLYRLVSISADFYLIIYQLFSF